MNISSNNLKRRLDNLSVLTLKPDFISFGQELFYEIYYHLVDIIHELDMGIPVEKLVVRNERETANLLKFGDKKERINVSFSDYKDKDLTELSLKIETDYKDQDFTLEHFKVYNEDGIFEYYNEYEDSNLRFMTGINPIGEWMGGPFVKIEYRNPAGYAITVWLTQENDEDYENDAKLMNNLNQMFEDFKERMFHQHALTMPY